MTQHKGEWQAKRPPVDRLVQRRSVGTPQQRPGYTTKTHEGEKLNMNHENFVTHIDGRRNDDDDQNGSDEKTGEGKTEHEI